MINVCTKCGNCYTESIVIAVPNEQFYGELTVIKMKALLLSGLLRKLYGCGDVNVIRERADHSVNYLQGIQRI